MTESHFFFPEALAEYEDAVAYYETCEPGLGARLIGEADAAICPDGGVSQSVAPGKGGASRARPPLGAAAELERLVPSYRRTPNRKLEIAPEPTPEFALADVVPIRAAAEG